MSLSAINNSSIDPSASLAEIFQSADHRLRNINRDSAIPTAETRTENFTMWRKLVEAARRELPEAIRPFVKANRGTNRDDFPTGISVAIDLPDCERIHFGPWIYDETGDDFTIQAPWKNKPFEVAGGNKEEFGDLLDAIARAREIYRMT